MTGLSLPDEAGRFMLILQRATLPRFASDNVGHCGGEQGRPAGQHRVFASSCRADSRRILPSTRSTTAPRRPPSSHPPPSNPHLLQVLPLQELAIRHRRLIGL